MKSCHTRGKSICAVCGSDAPDLVGGHRDTYACAAAENTEAALARSDRLARYFCKNGVVNGFIAVGSEILDVEASV